jgi:NAD(P)-dependent dehydrogenase (short-subunit alcohol dehydrogenase family)
MKIPKIIHQTISRRSSLGSAFHENIGRIKSLNPDWEYRLYDDADRQRFIAEHYGPDYLGTYNSIRVEYGAAKAGLISLVRSAAVELGPAGVRVNAVAPGVVWTPRVSEILGEAGRRRQSENAPLRRVALPADIAACVLFLVSDLAVYVTGQTLPVDGGVSVKFPYPMEG